MNCISRATCFLLSSAIVTMVWATEISDRFILDQPTPDSMPIIPEKPLVPDLNLPRTPVFNECAWCAPDRREWYDNIAQLRHMAQLCGYEYLITRFDRVYETAGLRSEGAYFFSIYRGDQINFDSAQITIVTGGNEQRRQFSVAAGPPRLTTTYGDSPDRFNEALFDSLAVFTRSFHSAMAVPKLEADSAVFTFTVGDSVFYLGSKGIRAAVAQKSKFAESAGSALFKLAGFQPLVKSMPSAGPVISDIAIDYPLNGLGITLSAQSPGGIRSIAFSSGDYAKMVAMRGASTEGLYLVLPLDTGHHYLTVEVTDSKNRRSATTYPIFEGKRQELFAEKLDNEQRAATRAWSSRNLLTKALYTASLFGLNVGAQPLPPALRTACARQAMQAGAFAYWNRNMQNIHEVDCDPLSATPAIAAFHYPVRTVFALPFSTVSSRADKRFDVVFPASPSQKPTDSMLCVTMILPDDQSPANPFVNMLTTRRAEIGFPGNRPGRPLFSCDDAAIQGRSVVLTGFPKAEALRNGVVSFKTLFALQPQHVDSLLVRCVLKGSGSDAVETTTFNIMRNGQQAVVPAAFGLKDVVLSRIDTLLSADADNRFALSSYTFQLPFKRQDEFNRMDLFVYNCAEKVWSSETTVLFGAVD
jgi:hypothetical protein